jgi:5-methyltetrahydropteroyltriglutamate--homocysteine methyltransferase
MGAYIGGLFPRSERFIDASRRRPDQLPQLVRDEKRRAIRLQRELKFAYLSDPLTDWHDLLRPFTTVPGVEAGPLVRFFENNTFYRRPIVTGSLDGEAEVVAKHLALDLLPRRQAWKVDLPEPYTFVQLSANQYYRDSAELLVAVANLLGREARSLARRGAGLVQLHGPALSSALDRDAWATVREGLQRLTRGLQIPVVLHLYFRDVTPIWERLLGLPVAGLGIDLSTTPADKLNTWDGAKILACGCVDARTTRVEVPTAVTPLVQDLERRLQPRRLYVTPSCDLEFIPYGFAKRKLQALAVIARELRADGHGH